MYSAGYFITSLWIYLLCNWIINFCVFITSPVVLPLKLAYYFFKGGFKILGWLQIQLCNLSVVSFENFLPFILLYVSIHDISLNSVLSCIIIFLFYHFIFLEVALTPQTS